MPVGSTRLIQSIGRAARLKSTHRTECGGTSAPVVEARRGRCGVVPRTNGIAHLSKSLSRPVSRSSHLVSRRMPTRSASRATTYAKCASSGCGGAHSQSRRDARPIRRSPVLPRSLIISGTPPRRPQTDWCLNNSLRRLQTIPHLTASDWFPAPRSPPRERWHISSLSTVGGWCLIG